MTDTVILTKALRDGRTATVTINGHTVTAWRGTEKLASHYGPHHRSATLPSGYVAAIGPLALTQEEADQIEAAWNEQASAATSLVDQRERLVEALSAQNQALIDYRADAWDRRDGGTDPYRHEAKYEARISAANDALAVFDVEHPEIADQARRQRDADVQRWMMQ